MVRASIQRAADRQPRGKQFSPASDGEMFKSPEGQQLQPYQSRPDMFGPDARGSGSECLGPRQSMSDGEKRLPTVGGHARCAGSGLSVCMGSDGAGWSKRRPGSGCRCL